MPTKTDRILSYLPGTFRALPRPTALYSVVDAFGNELLQAENSLASVMLAHWVDHADRGEELIDDLARIGGLYGLAPRADEEVEEYRQHLKRYVRTFLEGTVTVQGMLRVVAEVLGLHIADAYSDMDTWWKREDDALTTAEPGRGDAASLLFGVESVIANGSPSLAARVAGKMDLRGGVDLRGASVLALRVDNAAPVEVNFAPPGVADPSGAKLEEIRKAINDTIGTPIASDDGRHLALTLPTVDPASRLEVLDISGDAGPRLLGLLPRIYRGTDATAAQVTGTVDLGGVVDLSGARYLRLFVDGARLAEVDCARAADPAHTTLDDIKAAINAALGVNVASHDGHYLKLLSPKIGFASSIAFQSPAAQDATQRLFGMVAAFQVGRDPQPAKAVGTQDLSGGVDLSVRANIVVKIDANAPVAINCVGANPTSTLLSEIVAAINAALEAPLARHDGRSG